MTTSSGSSPDGVCTRADAGAAGIGGGTTAKTPTTMSAAISQAVASCKTSVEQAQVDASTKDDLKALCEKAASGDVKAVQKAAREICKKIIEKNLPAGSQRDQALQACDQAAAGSSP